MLGNDPVMPSSCNVANLGFMQFRVSQAYLHYLTTYALDAKDLYK